MNEPKAVACPRCGKPALEREFILAGTRVRVIECPCVPKGEPQWLVRSEPSFIRNPGPR